MINKASLRKTMRERRLALSDAEVRERSLAAQKYILDSEAWKKAPSVCIYMAVRNETRADALLENAWNASKDVFLPYMCLPPPAGIMRFLPYVSGQALVVNKYGILEPTPETCPLSPEDGWGPSLIIVPGLAYDRKGHRLGNGGGYYDRLLAKNSMSNSVRIGLAYTFQIISSLPTEKWDVTMHAIATDERIIWM